ncbi:MAG TPA: beta-ketoacyl synthase N-terminal-like domain-containing protein, partial [Polyangia bacterium]
MQQTQAFPKEQLECSLVARFAHIADTYRARVALRDDKRTLDYGEVAREACTVATAILALAPDEDTPVALLLDHSVHAIVAMLGVLAAGRAYVPLDPAYPRAQLEAMLADSGARLIVTGAAERPLARELGDELVLLDMDEPPRHMNPTTLRALAVRSTADSHACILYTSGSTGTPKGIVHTHRTLQHLVYSHVLDYGISAEDHLTLIVSTSYAASLSEIFAATLMGASLALASMKKLGVANLADWVRREGITVLKLPVSPFRAFLRALEPGNTFPAVRLVLLGGDALFRKDVERFRTHFSDPCLLVNRLASTESLCTTRFRIDRTSTLPEAVVPVGYANHDAEVLILDDEGRPVPAGTLGQIAVRSHYLSPGYLRRDELTRAAFVPGPADDARVTLMTGDLGRLQPDGCLEHFGRKDQQIKLRGYRVELAAVEAALSALDDVKEAAASVYTPADDATDNDDNDNDNDNDNDGLKRLVGYVVPAAGQTLSVAALKAALARNLPEFMIPSTFVVLDELPKTATGKPDRRALPAPPKARPLLAGVFVSPRTAVELRIAEIWAEVLGLPSVGTGDNFFDLGGDSLLLLRAHARIRPAFGMDVPLVELFAHPTVARVASYLAGKGRLGQEPKSAPASTRASALRAPSAPLAPERTVAIVGMALRFPGACGVEELWSNLRAGVESIRPLTHDELERGGIGAKLLADPLYVTTVPELPELRCFDAELFALSPLEAAILDPAHRLLLEVAWHALEHAGHAPGKFAGRIGVFAGASQSAYLQQHLLPARDRLASTSELQLRLATDPDFVATRIAYKLDLKGPALTVSTACSTSLVAVHLAAKSVLDGECEMALAGGASVESPEPSGYRFQEGWITSRDGRCRPFAAQAGGTVMGSGAGMVVLKRLDRALADGDTVHAVVCGTAINNDGSVKVGFAAPSVEGQAAVIAAAQKLASVCGDDIDYVETHGTGTALGDPVEIAALTQVFSANPSLKGHCAIGSVKSNIGHLNRAAGIAGLIKTVLALEHGEIPKSLHCEQPNPHIDFDSSPFFVNTTLRSWPRVPGRPRRAAVSSFGVGGTNAHMILEEAPAMHLEAATTVTASPWQLITLSARSPTALSASVDALRRHLEQNPDQDLADVAYTLHTGRQDLAERCAFVCRDRAEAVLKLAATDGPDDLVRRRRHAASVPALVFMFPGQGAQHAGMARGLYQREPSFRADIDDCAEALRSSLDVDLRQALFGVGADERTSETLATLLMETRLTQPALFVIEWALARLFMRWGIHPDAMIGHSIGEHTAACLAGVIEVEPTLRLIAKRGRLIQSLPRGRMLAVHLPAEQASALCSNEIALAAVNAPALCVLAGPGEAIDGLARQLAVQGIDHHLLRTSHAFHSQMMEPALDDFTRETAQVPTGRPKIPYVSGVTGNWITPEDAASPDYFSRLLRGTVRFSDGLRTLSKLPNAILLEIGPGRSLSTLARQHEGLREHPAFASMRSAAEQKDDSEVLRETLGELWLHGVRIDWEAVYGGQGRRRVPLPGYPFERREYWVPRLHSDSTSAAIPAQELLALSQYHRKPLGISPDDRQPAAVAPERAASPREQILAAPAADRHKLVSAYLTRAANRFLGHAPSHAFPADVPL